MCRIKIRFNEPCSILLDESRLLSNFNYCQTTRKVPRRIKSRRDYDFPMAIDKSYFIPIAELYQSIPKPRFSILVEGHIRNHNLTFNYPDQNVTLRKTFASVLNWPCNQLNGLVRASNQWRNFIDS